jgi:isoleucyl-tRNA synthetase
MTLLNVYNFFYQYATLDNWTPDLQPEKLDPLDRWILGKLDETVENVTESLDVYLTSPASIEIDRFVDILSKWYVRRSRRRFWKTEADDEKNAAYSTLYTCLKTVIHLLAPITPFLSEALYQRMVRTVEPDAPESIHHCRWPAVDPSIRDLDLMEEMDMALNISSAGRAARNLANIKLRQPLSEVVVVAPAEKAARIENVVDILREELNVKAVSIKTDSSVLQSRKALPIASILGRKYGRDYPKVSDAIKALDAESINRLVHGNAVTIKVAEKPVMILSDEVELRSVSIDNYSVVEEQDMLVGVFTVITEDLESEGLARDLVRRIQALRKDADFEINDRIVVYYMGSPEVEEVFKIEAEYIMAETLSGELINNKVPAEATAQDYEIDGLEVRLGIIKK